MQYCEKPCEISLLIASSFANDLKNTVKLLLHFDQFNEHRKVFN